MSIIKISKHYVFIMYQNIVFDAAEKEIRNIILFERFSVIYNIISVGICDKY